MFQEAGEIQPICGVSTWEPSREYSPKTDMCEGHGDIFAAIESPPTMKEKGHCYGKRERETSLEALYEEKTRE